VLAVKQTQEDYPQEEAMSPMIYYETSKTRYQDLIREAEKERLIKQALAGTPSLRVRTQAELGKLLIKFGSRLQSLAGHQHPAVKAAGDQ
jgi:hypothetical protein